MIALPFYGKRGVQTTGNAKPFEAYESLINDLSEINQRWDDWEFAEKLPLWERYLRGYINIVLWNITIGEEGFPYQGKWAVEVMAHGQIKPFVDIPLINNIANHSNVGNRNIRNNEIVLVDFVQLIEAPKVSIPVHVRFYRVRDELLNISIGDGLLYFTHARAVFKVLPFFVERKSYKINGGFPLPTDGCGRVVQSGSKVVYRVSDNESHDLANWFFGVKGKFKHISIGLTSSSVECYTGREVAIRKPSESIEVRRERISNRHQFFDVLIGPHNL